jgi:hypothetical protein
MALLCAATRHWSCYTTWPQEGRGGATMAKLRREMLAVNSFRERLYDNPIGHIWMTTDGRHLLTAPVGHPNTPLTCWCCSSVTPLPPALVVEAAASEVSSVSTGP